MRVVLNTLATLKAKTGVGHYAAQLAASLSAHFSRNELTVFPGDRIRGVVASKKLTISGIGRPQSFARLKNLAKSAGRHAVGSWFNAAYTPAKYDLYHEPNFLPLPSRLPTVITVHDLSVLLHPEWHPADRVRRHELAFRRAIGDSVHIITVSKSVRQDLLRYLQIAPHHVSAVLNGAGKEFFGPHDVAALRHKLGLPSKYLLYVGTIEPRKNLLTLLRTWCALPSAIRSNCPLLLAGGWGWKANDVFDFYEGTAKHCHVRHLGYIPDGERGALMAGARALAFPSHYEGFGLPPLEMLATGGAVLASTAAAHREVLGRHAHFVEPDDVQGWYDALLLAATDDNWLAQIRVGGREHAMQLTWDRAARETIAVYRSAIGQRIAA